MQFVMPAPNLLNCTQAFNNLCQQVRACELKYQRRLNSVNLLAVSKQQTAPLIEAIYQAGQHCFGESYWQEARAKIIALQHCTSLEWHFIGNIQHNKIKHLARNFAWVHSVTTTQIAAELNKHRALAVELSPLNICLEINFATVAQIFPHLDSDVLKLANYCQTLPHLKLRGLMVIANQTTNLPSQRAEFKQANLLFNLLKLHHPALDTLSMGMSADFEAAIAEGSTMVRIGSAIFGRRNGSSS